MNTATMGRRRLLYVSMETPRDGQASRTHIDEMIRHLSDLGWDTTLLASTRGGASAGASIAGRLVGYVEVIARARRAMAACDAVYVRSHFAAAPIAALARWVGKPVFHEVNGKPDDVSVTYPFLRPFASLISTLYRGQYRHAAHLFPVTDGLADWLRETTGHTRITVVPNAANTSLFTPTGPISPLAPPPYVIFVGGLVAWHGIDDMITATQHPVWPVGVSLVIVGDGIERARVAAAAAQSDRLVWLGHRAYQDVPAILRGAMAALCLIQSPRGRSDTGVAPMKLYEALACGVPVIASDLPFQADLLRRGDCGYVVPVGAPWRVAEVVAMVAASPQDARGRGQRGSALVATTASWQHRAELVSRIMSR